MKITLPALFSIIIVFFVSTTCYAFDIGARGIYWLPELDGNTQVDTSSIKGTKIDFNDDLNFGDENFTSVGVFVSSDKHNFELNYTNFDYSGINSITRTLYFNGQTYNIDDEVHSSLEVSMTDFYYTYDFINIDNIVTKFELGGVFQVKYLNGKVKITTTSANESSDLSIPVPMVGINLRMGMMSDMMEANLRGTGITYSEDSLYEIAGEVSWNPLPLLGVYGGYKAFAINVDEDDINLDYNMSGPYVAVELSF